MAILIVSIRVSTGGSVSIHGCRAWRSIRALNNPCHLFPSASSVVRPVRRGDTVASLRLRTVARPEWRVAELLTRLGLELPTRSRIHEDLATPEAANVVQKITAYRQRLL